MSGLLTAGLTVVPIGAIAQKPPMDMSVFDGWNHISDTKISPDGKVVSFETLPQEGDGRLTFIIGGKRISVDRGTDAQLSEDGRFAWFKIKSSSGVTDGEDTLGCINLKNFSISRYPSMKSFSVGGPCCAYLSSYKTRNGTATKSLVLLDEAEMTADTLRHVSACAFSNDGKSLAAIIPAGKTGKRKASVFVYDLISKEKTTLSQGMAYYSSLSFSEEGGGLVFLASTDTNSVGDRHCSLMYYDGVKCKELTPQGYETANGLTVNQNARPVIASGGKRVILGVAPVVAASDEDSLKLDIWKYDADLTPPQVRVMRKEMAEKTYKASIPIIGRGNLVQLAVNLNETVTMLGQGKSDYALLVDNEPYIISETWAFRHDQDLYLVSLKDGSRKEIRKGISGFTSVSPEGKYVLWFDLEKGHYYAYDVSAGSTVCLTQSAGTVFYDQDNDRPHDPYPYCITPVWTENDESVLINDRYNLWQFYLDGRKPLNITSGRGREQKLRFRYFDASDRDYSSREKRLDAQHSIGAKSGILMTVFDESGKKNGFAFAKAGVAGPESFFVDTMSFKGVVKAEQSDAIVFQKGNFAIPYNLWRTDDSFKSCEKLTDINPQQSHYSQGTARLVKWNASDGIPLEGILFLPEGADADSKVPLIVYFYERRSESLFDYVEPLLSRARINIAYMCSNGYAVFMPDVVFKTGHPGESAYNCIISGVESVCKEFGCLDKANMALDGQSWGGYLTAYLITRTGNMFKAAGAGAPVSNLTSAYGGIRWESGIVRIWQYEHDQGRMGKSLWDEGGLELYIENSPLFFADKIDTPLLMTSNDADGAVPWYQGIELFSAMRRLGKPVWMLQYNDEGHNLSKRSNCRDLTVRITQYFDYYLKGGDMPDWMKKNNY